MKAQSHYLEKSRRTVRRLPVKYTPTGHTVKLCSECRAHHILRETYMAGVWHGTCDDCHKKSDVASYDKKIIPNMALTLINYPR